MLPVSVRVPATVRLALGPAFSVPAISKFVALFSAKPFLAVKLPRVATVLLGLFSVVMPVVPIRVATFKIGATCVTGPFASKLNVVASDPTVTVPSTDTLAADGADVEAPAGTFVKPPTVSIARPGLTLDSNG